MDKNLSKKTAKVKTEKVDAVKPSSPIAASLSSIVKTHSKKEQIDKEAVKDSLARMKPPKEINGIKKEYLNSNSSCRVTFRLPKKAAGEAKRVTIVGDFSNWDKDAIPMKRLRNGDFSTTLELLSEREYRYRYLIDGRRWENDWCADNYKPNPFGCDDSVVVV
jgi:hypothetical protein